MVELQSLLVLLQKLHGLVYVLFVDREGNILFILAANGLQNHVHVDVALAQQVKNLKSHAGIVLQAHQGNAGDAGILCHPRDIRLLHFCDLLHRRAGLILQAGHDLQIHMKFFRQLHAAVMEHLGSLTGQLQHLVIGDLAELPGVRHDTGIGGIDAVHIRENLAQLGMERRRQRHGAGVRAAPAQSRDVSGAVDALKARHQDDAVLVQLRQDAFRVDPFDAGVAVYGRGLHPCLPPGQRHAAQAAPLQLHGAQGNRNLFAGGQQHVHLPAGGAGVDLLRLGNQVVGGVALGGQHHDHIVSGLIGLFDNAGHMADTLGVLYRTSAKFLHNQTH
ncbi:hypothetical protein SDC9_61464 [bioreactor metagenome]|uniref:Uncharacterized protein n=1 Tax=bioreactor metagenome TaxID=1076179 RepID=A0A644XH38_9ZZZZ